jgi:hypothetical protein
MKVPEMYSLLKELKRQRLLRRKRRMSNHKINRTRSKPRPTAGFYFLKHPVTNYILVHSMMLLMPLGTVLKSM